MSAEHLLKTAINSDKMFLKHWQQVGRRLVWVSEGRPGVYAGTSGNEGQLLAWRMIQGGVEIADSGKTIRAHKNQWVLLPDRTLRRQFDADAVLLSIKFTLHWHDGRALFPFASPIIVRKPKLIEQLNLAGSELLKQTPRTLGAAGRGLAERSADPLAHLELDTAMNHWLTAYIQVMTQAGIAPTSCQLPDERLTHTLSLLSQWDWRKGFSVESLAHSVGLSASRLSHVFTEYFHIPLMQYASRQRVQSACQLLERTSRPVKLIAYDLGFAQPSHFAAWFSKLTGISPRRYRQLYHSGTAD